jgi:hypothetical protein
MDFINIYIREARLIVFNTTFNNITVISWRSVLLREETGENHQPARSHWKTRLTRWVQLVVQELQILPEHPSSPQTFSVVCVSRSIVFMCMFCRLLFVLFLFATLFFFDLRILITLLVSSSSSSKDLEIE